MSVRRPAVGRSVLLGAGARSKVAACLLAAVLAGCGTRDHGERLLTELERMTFVPPGRCELGGRASEWRGVDLATALRVVEPLLVDRFEATRDDWLLHMGAPPSPLGLTDPFAVTVGHPERGAWPAFAGLDEARAFARKRHMRLLTAGEWVYVAAGATFQRYPWGAAPRTSVANTLELGLRRPLPVGTFESGLSTSGCYDLLGNVKEWVEGSLPPLVTVEWLDELGPSVMGGSYLDLTAALYGASEATTSVATGFNSQPLAAGSRAVDLGVRCAAEAEEFLLARLDEIDTTSGALRRLEEVGRRWGRAAAPLLERLVGERPRAAALEALLRGARG